MRLEGWRHGTDSRPWFETPRCARLLTMRLLLLILRRPAPEHLSKDAGRLEGCGPGGAARDAVSNSELPRGSGLPRGRPQPRGCACRSNVPQ
jgi:hypothetical protein